MKPRRQRVPTGIGLHADDLPRTVAAGVDVTDMRAEIEFLGGWAFAPPGSGGISPVLVGVEAVADAFGGRQVSAGEFSGDTPLDTDEALDVAVRALPRRASDHRGVVGLHEQCTGDEEPRAAPGCRPARSCVRDNPVPSGVHSTAPTVRRSRR